MKMTKPFAGCPRTANSLWTMTIETKVFTGERNRPVLLDSDGNIITKAMAMEQGWQAHALYQTVNRVSALNVETKLQVSCAAL